MNDVAVNIMDKNNNIDDKDLLIKAINDYGSYSTCTKKVLCTFIDLVVCNIVNIPPIDISKKLGISKTVVYDSIHVLIKDNIIKRLARAKFEINPDQLALIVQAYYKKQQFLGS